MMSRQSTVNSRQWKRALIAGLCGVVTAVIGVGSPAFAKKIEVPKETKGSDPAPDTAAARDLYKKGRYEEAIRQSKLALGRDERYVPALVVMANSYFHLKKYELSTSIAEMAKAIDPNNGEIYNLIGFIALTRDDRISATAAFKKATEVKEDFGPAWLNLSAQYLQSKNYDGAIEAAEKAVKLEPNSATAYMNLGAAYRGKLRYKDADAAFKKALDRDKSSSDAYFNLGILYLDAKEYPGIDLIAKENFAINYLNRYKQLAGAKLTKDDPADLYIEEAKKAIDREQKKVERLKKQQERNAAKAAADAAKAAAAPPAAPAEQKK